MNIGIDIDNVISKFNEGLLSAFFNEDKKLRNNGIINKDTSYITRGMFDWTEEEVNNFYNDNIQEIVRNLEVKKEPKIIDKIEVIWLGGNELWYKDNLEYNFKQDVDAVKIVFNSKVKLTILPCKNVVSELRIDIKTLRNNLGDKSDLCNYLINKFYNDGYHGIQESRVIWDISVIAYMINKNWFKIKEISRPNIMGDTSYELTNNNHKIKMVSYLDTDKIYKDLFYKLGVKDEN